MQGNFRWSLILISASSRNAYENWRDNQFSIRHKAARMREFQFAILFEKTWSRRNYLDQDGLIIMTKLTTKYIKSSGNPEWSVKSRSRIISSASYRVWQLHLLILCQSSASTSEGTYRTGDSWGLLAISSLEDLANLQRLKLFTAVQYNSTLQTAGCTGRAARLNIC